MRIAQNAYVTKEGNVMCWKIFTTALKFLLALIAVAASFYDRGFGDAFRCVVLAVPMIFAWLIAIRVIFGVIDSCEESDGSRPASD